MAEAVLPPFAMLDLPEDAYPFTVVAFSEEGEGPRLWAVEVTEPGAMAVPAFGQPVTIVIFWGDGTLELMTSTHERKIGRWRP